MIIYSGLAVGISMIIKALSELKRKLLGLLKKIRGSKLCIVSNETPPNVSQRNSGGMPKSMCIKKSLMWREIIDF